MKKKLKKAFFIAVIVSSILLLIFFQLKAYNDMLLDSTGFRDAAMPSALWYNNTWGIGVLGGAWG